MKKLNQAKDDGDDFEESVIMRKKAILEEEMKKSVLIDRLRGRPINIPSESAGAQRLRIDLNPGSAMNSRMSMTENFVFMEWRSFNIIFNQIKAIVNQPKIVAVPPKRMNLLNVRSF